MPIEFASEGVQKIAGLPAAVPARKPAKANAAESGALRQDLPPRTQAVTTNVDISSRENFHDTIEKKVEDLNFHVQNIQRDLHFSVDTESGRTVIRVIDRETRETIRTIPSEDFSVMAQFLDKHAGVLFNSRV